MFGNILSNAQITSMVKNKTLTLSPFEPSRLKLAHYRLKPGKLLRLGPLDEDGNREFLVAHDLNYPKRNPNFMFEPGEYMLVEVQEDVVLPPGVVGNFLPASSLIEQGFGLTAGKLDPGYGQIDGEKQRIIFGIKNMLNERNIFNPSRGLAHIFFVDLSGVRTLPAGFSQVEKKDFRDRDDRYWRALDDGPFYEEP
ncbi:hypothetical protein L2K20_28355 [Mycobacterium sp. MBM]|nr:hypothetical protein [Mycobacterium sp. MBM]